MPFRINVPTEDLLADLRRRLSDGYTDATLERIESLSKRADAELLRGLVGILVESIRNPPKRARGRPKKALPPITTTLAPDGGLHTVADLDQATPLTKQEARHLARKLALRLEIEALVRQLEGRMTKAGAIAEAARRLGISEPEARKALYRQ